MISLSIILTDVILLVFLLMPSIPLPICFAGTLLFLSLFGDVSMEIILIWVFPQSTGTVLLASPLFILAGTYMGGNGVAKRLLDCVDAFADYIKSGLGMVAVLMCTIMGTISGGGSTDVAAIGPIMIPKMEKQDYSRGYVTALVTVSSVLGSLISPSVIMIMFGWVTECSILVCFLSTPGSGLIITVLFCIIHVFWSHRFDLKVTKRKPFGEFTSNTGKTTLKAVSAPIIPLIIPGGTYGDVFTPTEAIAMAAIYFVPIGSRVYRACTFKGFLAVIKEIIDTVGPIMVVIICCLMLSRVFTVYRILELVLESLINIITDKYILLSIIDTFLFIVGMIVNDTTGASICMPLLIPVINQLGVSPVHFTSIMGVNLAMGGVTPPHTSILYLGMKIRRAEFHEVLKSTMTFSIPRYVPIVFLVAYWPDLTLAIPRMAGFVI